MAGLSRVANGDIYPSRFVKIDTTTSGRLLQCGAGDRIYGISGQGTDRPPLGALDTGKAAQTGEQFEVLTFGYPGFDGVVMLQLGGTVTRGDRLKADANGAGVTTTSGADEIGALAEDSGVSGNVIPVRLISPATV
jgi:hypothetical protein